LDVFTLRDDVVGSYAAYVRSFLTIADARIKVFVEDRLAAGHLWPDPLVQLNPAFQAGETIDGLVAEGILQPESARVFRRGKDQAPRGEPLRLHRHQEEAVRAARTGASYVLTTGTGSGKSLAYFVPIVDDALRRPERGRIKAIVVYPMNALCNSQLEELEKFLQAGYPEGHGPVTFARYTGQESQDERERIALDPPDVLLTNYARLELIMTRVDPNDRGVIEAAQGLRFLVLDELHTYRGRQGADVAMLVRRVRERLSASNLQCVGTSATIAGEGSAEERKAQVAVVATRLFGVPIAPHHVIGETLRRATTAERPTAEELRRMLREPPVRPDLGYEAFVAHPLAAWVERTFGLATEDGRLVRQTPITLTVAASRLAAETGMNEETCRRHLQQILLAGYYAADPDTDRPTFNFRLHQFVSRGDTVYTSLEAPTDRFLTMEGQVFVPGDRDRRLFPLAFCRECGQEYAVVDWPLRDESPADWLEPREFEDAAPADSGERRSGYLFLDPDDAWDTIALDDRFPENWLESGRNGFPRLRSTYRRLQPVKLNVRPDGTIDPGHGPGSLVAWFVPTRFRFCLHCGVAYASNQQDFTKLAELATEGRATATTVLSLSIVRGLKAIADLDPQARKLLSFTDNRQDASLQAGHFNDFVQVALLRGALHRAVSDGGALGSEVIAQRVVEALGLPFADYASSPEISYLRRQNTERALRDAIGYRVFQDLRRGWRVAAPNLEQTGQLRIAYEALDEIAADETLWRERRSVARDASPAERRAAGKAVLDFCRRSLAIKTPYLDPQHQDAIKNAAFANLKAPWTIETEENLETARVVRLGPADPRERGYQVAVTRRTALGEYLSRAKTWESLQRAPLAEEEFACLAEDLFAVLRETGLIEAVGEDRERRQPLYQLNPSAMRWERGSGAPEPDLLRLAEQSAFDPQVNEYFQALYAQVGLELAGLEAREHTAQVPSQEREQREERFRAGELAVMYCSPTMELGVDIADLNTVNLRNVPPTPANYAQRSGRAGRAGQPALVVTYCSSFSPHDQYFFRRQPQMVAGAISPPRIDLANEDLLRSHLQAVWLAETDQDLGKSLRDVLDLGQPHEGLPLLERVAHGLGSEHARRRARARCQTLLAELAPELAGVAWFTPAWLDDVIERAPSNFDAACNRWRQLYLSARKQQETQHAIVQDHSASRETRERAEQLRREAETQLKLLVDEGDTSGDFYSYRYFASEGFLPGYNFPRLPLSAYLPGRRQAKGVDDFVSRARFIAISEFGPRNIVYFEGSRFRIEKVILPPRDAETGSLTTTAKICAVCGYGHVGTAAGDELCHGCGARLDGGRYFANLFRMQNVSTKRVDRITSDEEERMRFGYDLLSAFRYATTVDERPLLTRATYARDGEEIATAVYAPAATLWRINLGWRRRKNPAQLGFNLDLETGLWAKKDTPDPEAEADGRAEAEPAGRFSTVVPFVEDRRNALILSFAKELKPGQMASLLYALKRGIATQFQLEDSELDGELAPDQRLPTRILLYEAAEGGAGVLSRLAEEPGALAAAARAALAVCHFDPETGNDLGGAPGAMYPCEAACYSCLLSYTNQRFHPVLDRRAVWELLRELSGVVGEASTGTASREELAAQLLARCESELERRFVRFLVDRGHRLPDAAQRVIPDFGTRCDFFYDLGQTCVYIDGPYHEYPERRERDRETTARLEDGGCTVVRFADPSGWDEVAREYGWIFVLGGENR
jgi:ATP-dependent helicase YprA (DUF1998 family)